MQSLDDIVRHDEMSFATRLLALSPLLLTMACPKAGPEKPGPPQIANPASVYCEQQGGRMEIVDAPQGQQGICVLPDGTRCDEWAFFRGQCPQPPLVPATTDQSGVYVRTVEDGGEWEYVYAIHAAGTKSERRIGLLRADGLDDTIADAEPGDTIWTPWGVMARVPDTPYERGFLLEGTHGQPIDPTQGSPIEVPESLRALDGSWTAEVGPWSYTVRGAAMGSRSERRIGRLRFDGAELVGADEGDYVDTPWGRMRWLGPVDLGDRTDYEQGFLLRGVRDRSFDELEEGDAVFPTATHAVSLELESLYLHPGIRVGTRPSVHSVSLRLSGPFDAEMEGTLVLDGNTCSLNDFGDKEICTLIAFTPIEVEVRRVRLADPTGLMRRIYSVTGEGLPPELRMVVQGELEEGELERSYLALGAVLVPLYVEDGV